MHVLAVPMFMEHPKYKLPTNKTEKLGPKEFRALQGTPSEQLIAHAGKGCYDAYGEDGRDIDKHIKTLIDSGHGSVLKHANISLFISGISRGCSHEFVRHRAGFSYSQRSTRYVAEEECSVVLEPYMASLYNSDSISQEAKMLLVCYLDSLQSSILSYKQAVIDLWVLGPEETSRMILSPRDKRKWARGKARQLLPIALETRMTVTANLRAWRHFLVMRSSRFAEPEIRRLSNYIYKAIQPYAPTVFQDFVGEPIDGFPEYTTPQPKV